MENEEFFNPQYQPPDSIRFGILEADNSAAVKLYKKLGLIPSCPKCGQTIDYLQPGQKLTGPCEKCKAVEQKSDIEVKVDLPELDDKSPIVTKVGGRKYITPDDLLPEKESADNGSID